MPKLLSRSKHEEFESNSALQIKDQKERRVENTKKMERSTNWVRNCLCAHCSPHELFTPPVTIHLFDALTVCYNFLFLPILSLIIAFGFGFFVTLLGSEHIQASVKPYNNQSIRQ